MNFTIDSGIAAILGAFVGAAAGVIGTIVAARITNKTERRRVAVEAALREWELAREYALDRGGELFPPPLFMYYNMELLKLLEAGRLTPATYRDLTDRRDVIRDAIKADSIQRREPDRE